MPLSASWIQLLGSQYGVIIVFYWVGSVLCHFIMELTDIVRSWFSDSVWNHASSSSWGMNRIFPIDLLQLEPLENVIICQVDVLS